MNIKEEMEKRIEGVLVALKNENSEKEWWKKEALDLEKDHIALLEKLERVEKENMDLKMRILTGE